MIQDEIAKLIANGDLAGAYETIASARRNLELSGHQARQLGRLVDEAKAKAPTSPPRKR